jgi:hypothetical protein
MANHLSNLIDACAAALAGCGQGKDDPTPDANARAKLRAQALDWMKAELSTWEEVALTAGSSNKQLIAPTLAHWKQDLDLSGIRDDGDLAKLPEAERLAWTAFWGRVGEMFTQAPESTRQEVP